MMYIFIFWLILLLFFLAYGLSKLLKIREIESLINENAALVFIILGVIIFMAIITKDPVTILGLNIPTEIQWLGSLFVFGFGAWQFYLRPLKSKVYELDREIGEVKVSVAELKDNFKIMDNKINLLVNKMLKDETP